MAFYWCKTCGRIDWQDSKHNCPPVFECRPEWYDDSGWNTFYASDSKEAAEKCAEDYDCNEGEYAIVGRERSGKDIILVRKNGELGVERYEVEGEAIPQYSARLIAAAAQ